MGKVSKKAVATKRKPTTSAQCGEHDYSEEIAGVIHDVLTMLGGKWKVLIIYHLSSSGMCRFGELQRRIPGVTQKMLTKSLREMEDDGIVERTVYAEVPPRVEYRLTRAGTDLQAVYREMADWGIRNSDLVKERCGEG